MLYIIASLENTSFRSNIDLPLIFNFFFSVDSVKKKVKYIVCIFMWIHLVSKNFQVCKYNMFFTELSVHHF